MPKISPAQEQQRRDQIMSAATTCFARQGYHATSMDDVVRECGLSVGALYTYFASKEDLFLAISEQRADQTLAYLSDLFRSPADMAQKSREAVDYFFSLLSDELVPWARMNVEFWSEAAKSERIKQRQERRAEMVRQFYCWLLSEARARGTLRPDLNLDAAVDLLMALNEGIVLLSVAGVRRVPLETLKTAYLGFLNAGLGGPGGGEPFPAGGPE